MGILNLDEDVSLKVKFKGVSYDVRQANIGEIQAFSKLLEEKDADEFDLTLELIDKIGMPKDIARTLTADQYQKLVSFVTGKDEKKS